jgi:hypothetical protein
MNLICFPHYTCGGLLCDIFQKTWSDVTNNGGIASISHSLGKIGDNNGIFSDYDPVALVNNLRGKNIKSDQWVGTHCWPGTISDLSFAQHILNVTTTTFRSKIYRWHRAYHHYYSKLQPWIELSGLTRIDKERETAKNYLDAFLPVYATNVTNIEFCEIVENSTQFRKLTANFDTEKHLSRWRQLNEFLYQSDIWNSAATKRLYEAELEINLREYYLYE